MPLSTVDGVPNSPTYRCECPPSWVGLNCDETLEEQAELGALFNVERPSPLPPLDVGGGHRRAQGYEPEPEPEPPLAAVMLHCRGQTPDLANEHCQRVHRDIGPGASTADGLTVLSSTPRGSKADSLESLSREQLIACMEQQLSVHACEQGAHRRAQDTDTTETADDTRRKLQQQTTAAVFHDPSDGSAKLCPASPCGHNPCLNGGVCSPSSVLATAGGEAAGFICSCTQGTSGATCEVVEPSPQFPGSRLVTPARGEQLNGWAGTEGQEWALCCSTFEGCDTAAKFHQACNAHTPTLTVARPRNHGSNPGDFTFGGFVRCPPPPLLAASGLRSVLVPILWPKNVFRPFFAAFPPKLRSWYVPLRLFLGRGVPACGRGPRRDGENGKQMDEIR
eukprot:COSAG04_NODE_2397_length_4209_cov_10.504380_1_plen_393_part_00